MWSWAPVHLQQEQQLRHLRQVDDLKSAIARLDADQIGKIKKALEFSEAAPVVLTEAEARDKYDKLVPMQHKPTIAQHKKAQPWGEKSWVEKLKVAEEVMAGINKEEAAAKVKRVEAAAAAESTASTKNGDGVVVLTEAGVNKLVDFFCAPAPLHQYCTKSLLVVLVGGVEYRREGQREQEGYEYDDITKWTAAGVEVGTASSYGKKEANVFFKEEITGKDCSDLSASVWEHERGDVATSVWELMGS